MLALRLNRIVGTERVREIITHCQTNNVHFICHKASHAGQNIACRGLHALMGDCLSARLARIFGIVLEINPDTLEPIAEQVQSNANGSPATPVEIVRVYNNGNGFIVSCTRATLVRTGCTGSR